MREPEFKITATTSSNKKLEEFKFGRGKMQESERIQINKNYLEEKKEEKESQEIQSISNNENKNSQTENPPQNLKTHEKPINKPKITNNTLYKEDQNTFIKPQNPPKPAPITNTISPNPKSSQPVHKLHSKHKTHHSKTLKTHSKHTKATAKAPKATQPEAFDQNSPIENVHKEDQKNSEANLPIENEGSKEVEERMKRKGYSQAFKFEEIDTEKELKGGQMENIPIVKLEESRNIILKHPQSESVESQQHILLNTGSAIIEEEKHNTITE